MPTTKTDSKEATHTIECHDVVHLVQFSPFDWSSSLIAFATADRVTIATAKFQDEAVDIEGMEYCHLRDFHHSTRPTALAWSPETSLLTIPKLVRFCTGGVDRKIRVFTTDLKAEDNLVTGVGHTDYINDVTFDPDKGEHVASVSDDQTCRVWNMEGEVTACLPLSSPGMSVCWHHEDPLKVMIAEKRGVTTFFNVMTQQPILSVDCSQAPLLAADWCPANLLRVAAVAGPDWFIFDTSRSSRAIDSGQCHSEGGRRVKWAKSHDHYLATLGSPGSQVRVTNIKTGQLLVSADLHIANALCWHYRLPLLAVAGDKKVHVWELEQGQ